MTDELFTENARQMATALVRICEIKSIPTDEAAQMIGAACSEAMAHFIGPALVPDRLRDIADISEAEVLRAI